MPIKQKRRITNNRNIRNSNNRESVEDDTDDLDERNTKKSENEENNKKDRLDDITSLHVPFWDTYDTVNQLYLELGEQSHLLYFFFVRFYFFFTLWYFILFILFSIFTTVDIKVNFFGNTSPIVWTILCLGATSL